MPWTKLKNIILLILVLTNLCLLGLVVGQNIQSSRQLSQTREYVLHFLRERGVEVEEEVVPQSIQLTPQVSERDREEERAAAAGLLSGPVEEESRGGEIYRYFNGNGSIQFSSDGSFSASLEPGVYPVGQDRAETCLSALETMGFEGLLIEEGEEGLIFRQSWNDIPIFSHQVSVTCTAGSVSAISGHRLMGQPRADATRQTITAATALVRFLNGVSALGDVCNRIDAIDQGYIWSATLSGVVTMTPAWQITTDTGVYQLDAVTGSVKRAD